MAASKAQGIRMEQDRTEMNLAAICVRLLVGATLLAAAAHVQAAENKAKAGYARWTHSGTIYILTTPEGAGLPAAAREDDFPLLVRLDKDFFDFAQARPNGQDVRFAGSNGTPLAYEIEQWDKARGTASIWVRIPEIRGNARQAIRVYWGNSSAASESNGEKVFTTKAAFAGVWHLGADFEDSTANNLDGFNHGSINAPAIIGDGQALSKEKTIYCAEDVPFSGMGYGKVACLPAGNQDRSMSAWINPTSYESTHWTTPAVGGWGVQRGRELCYMRMSGRGEIQFHGNGMDPKAVTRIPFGQWHHAALTISKGKIRFYLDGREDYATDIGTLKTVSPSACNVGKHTAGGHFQGALDEVRFEAVARSADWMRLCYENQKPLQTLAGPLVQDGPRFSVSPSSVAIKEGERVAITASAGGAQKLDWILSQDLGQITGRGSVCSPRIVPALIVAPDSCRARPLDVSYCQGNGYQGLMNWRRRGCASSTATRSRCARLRG